MLRIKNVRRVQPKVPVSTISTGLGRDLVLAVNLQNGIVRNAVNGELAVLTGTAATPASTCGLHGKLFATANYAFTRSNGPASGDNFTVLVIQNYKANAANFQTAISFNADFALYAPRTSGGALSFDTLASSSTDISGAAAIATGKSQTIVVTKTSTVVTSYINGAVQSPTGTPAGAWTAPVTIRIGSGQGGTEYCLSELDLVLVWKRVLSLPEIDSISDNPWQVFDPYNTLYRIRRKKAKYSPKRTHSYDLSGNGWFDSDTVSPIAIFDKDLITLSNDITLALSGASVTTARGNIAPNTYKPIAGSAITSASGTFIPSNRNSLAGSASTSSSGTVIPSTDKDLAGGVITSATGIISVATVDVTIAIGGSSISVLAGSLSVSTAINATGQSVTLSAGALTSGRDKAITGTAITSASGTTVANNSKALTGSASTLSGGTLVAGTNIAANGVSFTGSSGTLIPSLSKALSGTQLSSSAGFVSAGNDVNVALSGSQFSSLAGTLSVSVSKTATGTASTLAVGQVVANTSKAITGSASTLSAGSMTKTVSIAMLGGAVTPSAGTVKANTSKAITGSASTLGQGTVVATFGLVVQLSGVQLTTTAGNLSVSSAVGLSGTSTSTQAGQLAAALSKTLSGVVGTFSSGSLTATITAGTGSGKLYVVYIDDVQNNVFIKSADYNVSIKTDTYNVFYDNNSNYTVEKQ
jgi:hypothetical protein